MIINTILPVNFTRFKNVKTNIKNNNAQGQNSQLTKNQTVNSLPVFSPAFLGTQNEMNKIIADAKEARAKAVFERKNAKSEYEEAFLKLSHGVGLDFRDVYDGEDHVIRSFKKSSDEILVTDFNKDGQIVSEASFLNSLNHATIMQFNPEKKIYLFAKDMPFNIKENYRSLGLDGYACDTEFVYNANSPSKILKDVVETIEGDCSAKKAYFYTDDTIYYLENYSKSPLNEVNWSRGYEIDSSGKAKPIKKDDEKKSMLFS